MKKGRIIISGEMWLDLLCFDSRHRIVAVKVDKRGDVAIDVEGPDMPESTAGVLPIVTPVYRTKNWERIDDSRLEEGWPEQQKQG